MSIVIGISLTLVLIGAGVIVFTDEPSRQAVALSVYGLLLTILFMSLQAPDVALSQLAIGTAVVPLLVMLSVRKIASVRRDRADRDEGKQK